MCITAALLAAGALAVGVSGAVAAPRLVALDPTIADPAGDGDGALEPGESADVTVRLGNIGTEQVPAFDGSITSSPANVTVSQANGTWPALAVGEIEPGAPPFGLALSSGVGCGAQIDLGLTVTSVAYTATLPVKILAGAGPETASTDPGLPREIYYETGNESTLDMPGPPGTVKNLRVRIGRLDHDWLGDLTMTLTSPEGTTVTLMDGPGAGLWGSPAKTFVDLTLADDADVPIEQLSQDPREGVAGTYRPDEPLSAFDDESKAGTWTLDVKDTFAVLDSGRLYSWGISPVGVVCLTPGNDGPIARRDAYTAAAGVPLNGASVLANDADPEGDALTASLSSPPAHGLVSLAPGGTFTYTSQAGYAGTDSFTYAAHDASAPSIPTKATITVSGPQRPPVIANDAVFELPGGHPLRGNVLDGASDPNGDALTVQLTGGSQPAGGLSVQPDGSFFYQAPFGEKGVTDVFEYRVSDGHFAAQVGHLFFFVNGGAVPAPVLPPAPPKPIAPTAESRAFANFQIKRAAMSGGKLKVRAVMSTLASGKVKASFRSAGRTRTASATIASGAVRFSFALSARQRRSARGVLKLAYAGNARTRPERVAFNVARRSPGLRAKQAFIDGKDTLRVAGTIGRRARGVVRVHLTYSPRPGVTKVYDYKAKIRAGKWSLRDALPAEATRVPCQVTIRYLGDRARGIGGAHISQDVG